MLAKGLQECPKSGILWAEAIEMEVFISLISIN